MYREIIVPIDNSVESLLAMDCAIELCRQSGGRITGNHVYAARLHDIRFRQLETGLPAQFQTPEEIRKQRKIHDKLIEKGLQLISDSFLDQAAKKCDAAGIALTRQLLEGINYEEIIREVNRGGGRLPSLIGFDPNIADKYDGGSRVRSDVRIGENGRLIAEDEAQDEKLAGTSERNYDLLCIGAHGIGRQPYSQLGGVTARVLRAVDKDTLIVKNDRPLRNGRWIVCVDGSSYSYKAMRVALEMAREFNATLYVCSAFDVEYHHAVFGNIKDVLSVQASKVFKFEEQEELHNNIIDKGLLKLCQANLKRAEVMHRQFLSSEGDFAAGSGSGSGSGSSAVEMQTQILIGKPFQCIMQWVEEIEPSLLILARHGGHRIDGTDIGSQAENLCRLAPTNVLLIGTTDVRPEDIPWIEEDGETGLEWEPQAEVRILRVPPFALGIARKAVEEFVVEHYMNGHGVLPIVTNDRLDEAIKKLLPTHMQLIMGIGTAEELALAEVKAQQAMERTVVEGHDEDEPSALITTKCPYSGHVQTRERTAADPVVWTNEAYGRLNAVPLIARPLARNTVEKFAREHSLWRITTHVMDENKQAMIEADTFDMDTMLVMFRELQTKQLRAAAEGVDGLTPEMRRFIEEAKASGITRCPIRDVAEKADACPVDFKTVSPAEAKKAIEEFMGR